MRPKAIRWALTCVLLLAGCGRNPTAGQPVRLSMPPEEYPATEGSRELRPLLRLTAARVMAIEQEWEDTVGPDGKGREVVVVGDLDERRARERVLGGKAKASGTDEAYRALIDGEVELVLAIRPPSDAEIRRARDRGVEIDAEPVALDALVFLVYRDSPVSNLLVRQIREIYAGRITDWGDLGAAPGPITAYRRIDGAPSQALMQRLVMRGEAMAQWPDDELVHTLDGPVGSAGLKPGSLSYTRLPNARHQAETERIKLATVDGVAPTSDEIRQRRYPLAVEVFVATRKPSPELEATGGIRLRRWLLSEGGQRTVEDAGYAPVLDRSAGRAGRAWSSANSPESRPPHTRAGGAAL